MRTIDNLRVESNPQRGNASSISRLSQTKRTTTPSAQALILLEDLHGIAIVAERHNESTIDFEELKRRLKADGLL